VARVTVLPQGVDPTSPEAHSPLHLGVHRIDAIRRAGGVVRPYFTSNGRTYKDAGSNTGRFRRSYGDYFITPHLKIGEAHYRGTGNDKKRVWGSLAARGLVPRATLAELGGSENNYHNRTFAGLARLALILAAGPNQQPLCFDVEADPLDQTTATVNGDPIKAAFNSLKGVLGLRHVRDYRNSGSDLWLAMGDTPSDTLAMASPVQPKGAAETKRLSTAFGVSAETYDYVREKAADCVGSNRHIATVTRATIEEAYRMETQV